MILLINPKTTKPTEFQSEYFREPSLGILYLAAVLDQNNLDVDILDLEQYLDLKETILEELIIEKIQKYEIIGITSLTNTFNLALKIANIVKQYDDQKYVILGGPHVSFLYEEILQSQNSIDFICISESENSFLYLVEILKKIINTDKKIRNFESYLQKIKGLAFINSRGKLIFTGYPELIDIETTPLPARYKLEHIQHYYRVANVIINRGCPFQCSFCSRQNLFRKVRIRSISSILSEIRDIISFQNYYYINFYDNINIDKDFFKKFCNMFIENNIKIPWGCELRVDNITKEDARLLKTAGCELIATGIESASIEVLKKNFKYQNPNEVMEGIINLKKYLIPIQAYFVLGLPGETEETFYKTIDFIKSLPFDKNDTINYFVATPYPGSRLWEEGKIFNINIIENDFSKYDCQHIIFETEDLDLNALQKLLKTAKAIEKYNLF
ncbi:MAG: B12-binding domain-containing radical SAM protein [Candidatus Hermodarchaeota archaeon]